MKLWATEIVAIDQNDGVLKKWPGILVPGVDMDDALDYLEQHGLGYMRIVDCVEEKEETEDFINQMFIITLS